MKTTFWTVLILIAGLTVSHSQQDTQFTQYVYNTMALNPAYAGTSGVFTVTPLYRAQWSGIDGAPTTQSLNVHAPVGERLGVGMSFIHDEIGNGTSQETNIYLAASYSLPLDAKGNLLALGLNAGGQLFNIDFLRLQNYVPTTGVIPPNIDRKFSPNFGVGAYWYNPKFYVGVSVPNFLETEHFDGSSLGTSNVVTEQLGVYVMGGYVLDLSSKIKLKPAFLLRSVSGSPLQTDISTSFLFNERFTLGVNYRWDAAFSGLFGFNFNDNLTIGLAYDRDINALGDLAENNGSYEILLQWRIFNKARTNGGSLGPSFF